MTVSRKVINETAEMIKAEYNFQVEQGKHMSGELDRFAARCCASMAEYFARQSASIFKRDNPAFDEKKFFSLCGMDWLS